MDLFTIDTTGERNTFVESDFEKPILNTDEPAAHENSDDENGENEENENENEEENEQEFDYGGRVFKIFIYFHESR